MNFTCRTLLLFLILGSSIASVASTIEASIQSEQMESYYINLTNNRSDFVCVASDTFNTQNGYVVLTDSNGSEVRQRLIADNSTDIEWGFDFMPSYFILRPNENRKIGIDMTNFFITEGKYAYKVFISAYICKDVVDKSRLKAKREVKSLSIEREGVIEFDKEFIRLNNIRAEQKSKSITPSPIGHESMHNAK